MRRFFRYWTPFSVLLLLACPLEAQPLVEREIPVVSEFVGATIDAAEQQYYQIFENVKGFRSAQFRELDDGFAAIIRTERGLITRHYDAREFYDLALSIDLSGKIDPVVWEELSGKLDYEATVTRIDRLPIGVQMILEREEGKPVRGVYQGFELNYLYLTGLRSQAIHIPLVGLVRIRYREGPVADLKKDVWIFAVLALGGLAAGEIYNLLTGAEGFDLRWRRRFAGGGLGLLGSPFVVYRVRRRRAPEQELTISPETREKIEIYTAITFDR